MAKLINLEDGSCIFAKIIGGGTIEGDTTFSDDVTIDGILLVGTTTQYSTEKVGVNGSIFANAADGAGLCISRTSVEDDESGVLEFRYGGNTWYSASIEAKKLAAGSTDLYFYNGKATEKNAVATMVMKNTGDVGIGLLPTANMEGLSIESGLLTLKERATPTADADYGKIYTKADNSLYFQDGAGVESDLQAGGVIPQVIDATATKTLALTDAGKIVRMTSGSANVLTIPLNATVAFRVNQVIIISQAGAGVTTITGVTGVTLNGVASPSTGGAVAAQYNDVSLRKVATDTWEAIGAIGAVS